VLSRDEVLGGLTGGVLAGLLLQVGAVDGLQARAAVYGIEATTVSGWGHTWPTVPRSGSSTRAW
jgi:hypothetical protein